MIKLSENFTIKSDTYSWVLEKTETKIRIKKDTEEKEEYEHTEKWYYPKLSQCLNTYLQESLKPLGGVVSLGAQMENIQAELEKLNKNPCNIFRPN